MPSAADPTHFGPFRILASAGKGGMGEVFRAVHLDREVEVAVKVMSARRARDPHFSSALRAEVRAVARLHHPGIIMVFDCGEVSPQIEEETGGRFVAGSSWLAMELASYSLQDLNRSTLDWWHVRNILVRILDALAHSHARGVIHRDLKPANVLFVDGAQGRQLKLSDFGLAHALDDEHMENEETPRTISGTPRFMSPEQITGQWRDHGPWTDLYALGCLAYWLVDGEPPFRDGDTDAILRGHLQGVLPPLRAPFAVPREFGVWLGQLLAKSPMDRFQRAADAAQALFALGEPDGEERPVQPSPLGFVVPLNPTLAPSPSIDDLGMTEIISDVINSPPSVPELRALERPPSSPRHRAVGAAYNVPRTWHRKEAPPLSLEMVGVGLGLFGLRQVPLVNRDAERDALWESLRQVAHHSNPRVALLRGGTGTGKSRLASWMAERAHELGAATPLIATHSPLEGPADGLGGMMANHLRCVGLPRERVLERVRQSVSDTALGPDDLHDCLALTEIICAATLPDYREDEARIRFRTPAERYVVIERFLRRFARTRPLLVVLDDLQWGNDALAWLEHLMRSSEARHLALLVVGTVQTDALLDRPLARQRLRELTAQEPISTIEVGPLSDPHQRALVSQLLGLDAALIEQVTDRTSGNPLYAVQLVGDWVERGVLQLGPGGFRLVEGESSAMPTDLHQVFRERLRQIVRHDLREPPSDALLGLELAAVLGTEVHRREWKAVCRKEGVPLPLLAVDQMVATDLATLAGKGWSFTHEALRETLVRLAEEQGRLTTHHAHCARALEELYPTAQPGLALRRARHLIAAGLPEEALGPMLQAAGQARVRCEFELAHAHLQRHQALLDELCVPHDDVRRAEGWLERAMILIRQDELAGADEILERAVTVGQTRADQRLVGWAMQLRADVANRRGQIPEGLTYIEEARAIFEATGEVIGQARTSQILAELRYWAGEYYEAEQHFRRARQLFRKAGEDLELARVEMALGALYTTLGNPQRATAMLLHAREVFERYGDVGEVASVLNNLGEVHRQVGNLHQAERAYLESLAMLERIGMADDVVVLVNLGMVRLVQNHVDDAAPLFRKVLTLVEGSQRGGYLAFAHLANLSAAAHHGRWEQWDHHLAQGEPLLESTGFVDADLAVITRDAGERALRAGEHGRARRALQIARSQWLSMARQDQAAAIDRILLRVP
ncbi:serine/threonine-protein kinase PknK [Lujinxingia sediminis]|uniref:serine/threonine-protein kinase n=1 Tax=Lujinxingia sediminis TaxID=2480984 RepID=UPI0013E2F5C6|nr:serine/threonine-protein kinase [Lujinxingia sediminis]